VKQLHIVCHSTDDKDSYNVEFEQHQQVNRFVSCVSQHLFQLFFYCLVCHSTDEKDTLKAYTNPHFFFELWFSQIQKEVEKKRPVGKKLKVSRTIDLCKN